MKTCPICGAHAFDDAVTCFGCLHQFEDWINEASCLEGEPKPGEPASPGRSGVGVSVKKTKVSVMARGEAPAACGDDRGARDLGSVAGRSTFADGSLLASGSVAANGTTAVMASVGEGGSDAAALADVLNGGVESMSVAGEERAVASGANADEGAIVGDSVAAAVPNEEDVVPIELYDDWEEPFEAVAKGAVELSLPPCVDEESGGWTLRLEWVPSSMAGAAAQASCFSQAAPYSLVMHLQPSSLVPSSQETSAVRGSHARVVASACVETEERTEP